MYRLYSANHACSMAECVQPFFIGTCNIRLTMCVTAYECKYSFWHCHSKCTVIMIIQFYLYYTCSIICSRKLLKLYTLKTIKGRISNNSLLESLLFMWDVYKQHHAVCITVKANTASAIVMINVAT